MRIVRTRQQVLGSSVTFDSGFDVEVFMVVPAFRQWKLNVVAGCGTFLDVQKVRLRSI